MNTKQRTWLCIAIFTAIIIIDQLVKILVKTHMYIGQDIPLIGSWCRLHFIENEGFAFGTSFGGVTGKYLLTLFRIAASVAIVWIIVRHLRHHGRFSLILCLTLILAGALGNIIDSCFYGLIFSESYYQIATLFPASGGYAPFLQGKVVDMFYFPLFSFQWPQWLGGGHFEFFSAIFNIADAAITIGVIWLLIDQILLGADKKKSCRREKKFEKNN